MNRFLLLPPAGAPIDDAAPSWPARAAAAGLLAASRSLDRAARRLVKPAVLIDAPDAQARVEFHAEAGAPEGALYIDGQFVGFLPGVARL
jgi:hypothetical protein